MTDWRAVARIMPAKKALWDAFVASLPKKAKPTYGEPRVDRMARAAKAAGAVVWYPPGSRLPAAPGLLGRVVRSKSGTFRKEIVAG